ncbi:HCL645Wp [Eremothecium sinecaudum]|uniref:HCL645Wp n=1 Tax=Eremothecium sinecaudum TaxID=45286 RepID=A0A109UVV4_9SACH|nr:HCL645Wp [Eremothecium sinecaudum]AMD19506.1 HCL645Wp [Eremothecium sinecaudum]
MTDTADGTPELGANFMEWSVDDVVQWTLKSLGLNNTEEHVSDVESDGNGTNDDAKTCSGVSIPDILDEKDKSAFRVLDNVRTNIKTTFHEHKISGEILPYLSLENCKLLFSGEVRLAVKFKISLNKLTDKLDTQNNALTKHQDELVSTLNNLHHTIADKLQEYQSQYIRLRGDVLEVMRRSAASSVPGIPVQPSHTSQDYFERGQSSHQPGAHLAPLSPRNHPAFPGNQHRTSFTTTPSSGAPGSSAATPPGYNPNSNGGHANQMSIAPSVNEPLKQLRASKEDSTEKILKNAMKKHNLNEADWKQYVLVICYGDQERVLEMDEQPVVIFKNLKQQGLHPAIMLRQKGDFEEVGELTPGGRL